MYNITIALNLYSEFMIKEAMENMKGIKFNEINITDTRYAADAVLVADKRKKHRGKRRRRVKTIYLFRGLSDSFFDRVT